MGGIIDNIVDVIDPIAKWAKEEVDFIGDYYAEVNALLDSVNKGTWEAVGGMFEGIVKGDWTLFRDSFVTVLQTALYVIAAIVGGMTGNIWLVIAAAVALDGLHNDGKFTTYAVTTLGEVEEDLFGSRVILDNVEIITNVIIVVGSIYAGAAGGSAALDMLGKGSMISQLLNSTYYNVAMGAMSMYDAYTQMQYAQGLYDELMSQYQAWLEQMGQAAQFFNTMWDKIYLDEEMLYEASAGGYLFNAGAGSQEYSVSSIHEQSAYLLGVDIKRDATFDKYFSDAHDIDYPRLDIEDTKPEILRYVF